MDSPTKEPVIAYECLGNMVVFNTTLLCYQTSDLVDESGYACNVDGAKSR